jgi:hypothetical protein
MTKERALQIIADYEAGVVELSHTATDGCHVTIGDSCRHGCPILLDEAWKRGEQLGSLKSSMKSWGKVFGQICRKILSS